MVEHHVRNVGVESSNLFFSTIDMGNKMPETKERLFSLDLLRGLDMMVLTLLSALVHAANKVWRLPDGVMAQFKHGWECFTFWDIIMPLFIFMCGAAIPFALPRRMENGRAGWKYWRHVFGRVAFLWVCGMLVQGNLITLDPLKIGLFSNTLQSIAVGYLATACVMLLPRRWVRVGITASLFVAYAAILHAYGDYTPEGNVTAVVERKVFAAILPAGSQWLNVGKYTWILPSMMFAAMTLCGFHATEILKSGMSKPRKAAALFGCGAGALALGWAAAAWIPVIKPIYTVSFTLQAMGWCAVALSALYVLTDILKWRRGLAVPILFGQYALTAYMVTQEPIRPALQSLVDSLTRGFPMVFGEHIQPMVKALCLCILVTLALVVRKRLKSRT